MEWLDSTSYLKSHCGRDVTEALAACKEQEKAKQTALLCVVAGWKEREK